MISVHLQGKSFNITIIQAYAPTANTQETEVEWLYEDLQDLLGLTPKKDVLYIIGDWNAKVGSHEIPSVTSKFSLSVQNEAEQRLTGFCQENTRHRKHPLPTTQETTLHMDITRCEIKLIIFFAVRNGEPLYSQQKQDLRLIMAHIICSLLQNSGLN